MLLVAVDARMRLAAGLGAAALVAALLTVPAGAAATSPVDGDNHAGIGV